MGWVCVGLGSLLWGGSPLSGPTRDNDFVWDTCLLMQMSLYLTRVPLVYLFFDVTFRGSLPSEVSGS